MVRRIRIGYRCRARRQAIANCVVHDHILIGILEALDKRLRDDPILIGHKRRVRISCDIAAAAGLQNGGIPV
jgi:hypothetical protein